ncbi:chromate efflux transporter [Acidobacteria bacterium AB60]|nr:chromate efflux transporter [Acidobacteria bacterium AB60]
MTASRARLAELFRFFSRLGLTAFGGPAAHIALMEHEAVETRQWLSREQFLDLVGACNLLPGPGSTQVAMTLGYTRAGWAGLAVAGACFIVPAAFATLALAWAYVRFGSMPRVQGLLYGAKPVMIAIITQAIWRLARMALRRRILAALGLICFAAIIAGAQPLLVLLGAGALLAALAAVRRLQVPRAHSLIPLSLALLAGAPAAGGLTSIFLIFLKLGIVVFGSGYVLLAFLQTDLVDRLHWVTQAQLLDAVTAGQVTPGPVFATATFLGYVIHGFSGAATATAAIFLPSFFMAGLVAALASRMRRSPVAAAFLDGVNAAAIALMADVAIALGRATLIDVFTWALAAASAILLIAFRVNATWLILGGALLGMLLQH